MPYLGESVILFKFCVSLPQETKFVTTHLQISMFHLLDAGPDYNRFFTFLLA